MGNIIDGRVRGYVFYSKLFYSTLYISLADVFSFPMMKRLCARLITGGNKPI